MTKGNVRSLAALVAVLMVGVTGSPSGADARLQPQPRQVDRGALTIDLSQPVASGLSSPIYVTHAGDGSGRLFIVEQGGRIRILEDGQLLATPFLDIRTKVVSGGERGLLSVAFHPNYAENGRFFVNYTARVDGDLTTFISEYTVSANPDVANTQEKVILTYGQPFDNHNGGQLQFGPDGYLYIGSGDGGAANDPFNNGQNVNSLLGKILRIDIDTPSGGNQYSSPPDNPFVNQPFGRPEIFAYGLRNPWRFSFDRGGNHDLYAGDVGQNCWEEIDIIVRGGNYGWNDTEGNHCFSTSSPNDCNPGGCNLGNYMPAIAEYSHNEGCSVTGGYVYRGQPSSPLFGTYIYGDFCSGMVYGYRNGVSQVLASTGMQISSFGEDEDGELYLVRLSPGEVRRIIPPVGPDCEVTCPDDVTVVDVDEDGTEVVVYDPPEAVGDCGAVTCLPAPGADFAVGVTEVTCTSASGPSCSFSVTVAPADGFAVTDCSPDGAKRKTRLTVTVSGFGFEPGATVSFGQKIKIISTTYVSPTRIDVEIKVKKKAKREPRDVVVTNPGGEQAVGVGCFTVLKKNELTAGAR